MKTKTVSEGHWQISITESFNGSVMMSAGKDKIPVRQEDIIQLINALREFIGSKKKFDSEHFNSPEFQEVLKRQIDSETWDKGLPKVYANGKGEIVHHWKDGKIEVVGSVH